MEQSRDRIDILKKIELYEKNKWFDIDVEEDPPTIPLIPNEVDYAQNKLSTKIKSKFANVVATIYFDNLINKGKLRIKKVYGIENFEKVKEGAFITCNHFNAFDNYAVWTAIKKSMNGRMLYKVIREGNYTSYGGLYGFFFKNCNTLPLSNNRSVMREFLDGLKILINRGEKILIYPEQAMWWNYKKPRPMKNGAFNFAVKLNAPIIPCFITMEDSDELGEDSFYIQDYTLHFFPAIYPKKEFNDKENIEYMKNENYRLWKEKYEEVYQKELEYGD